MAASFSGSSDLTELEIGQRSAEAARRPTPVPRILMIDDLVPAHWLISSFLAGANFEVFSVATPDRVVEVGRAVRPDVIVLDPAMADHGGWEVLAELQSDPQFARVPTVLYTALPEPVIADHAARCLYEDLRHVSKLEDLDCLLDRLAEATGAPALTESWSA